MWHSIQCVVGSILYATGDTSGEDTYFTIPKREVGTGVRQNTASSSPGEVKAMPDWKKTSATRCKAVKVTTVICQYKSNFHSSNHIF